METLALTLSGSIIIILLSIIGYFIVKDKKAQEETNNKLFDMFDKQRPLKRLTRELNMGSYMILTETQNRGRSGM